MGSTRSPIFYKDKPIFGLDIGTGSIKAMQTHVDGGDKPTVFGYGSANFDLKAIRDGEIIDPETIAKTAQSLFENHLTGSISTHRVALSVPASRTYTREMQLPKMSDKELQLAVLSEAEQYIPRSLEELYLDYTINQRSEDELHLYTVAAPKKIVDSYMTLAEILGLETVLIEPTISASTRVITLDKHNNTIPSVFLDLGTHSAEISIFDKYVTVTGTVQSGGQLFTEKIMEKLGVTEKEAVLIKTKYGLSLSKKQEQIREAIEPLLSQMIREIRRMIRYYEERSSDGEHKIGQVITTGGGANMPGLTDYLTEKLRIPTRMFDPWQVVDYGKLQPPSYSERALYMTVAGLSLADPKAVFI